MILASQTISSGTILLILLMLVAILIAYAGLIWLSLWITSKINGSKALVWGAMLGVVTANFLPLLSILLGQGGQLSFLYESLLPSALAASMLACAINLFIWHSQRSAGATVVKKDSTPRN